MRPLLILGTTVLSAMLASTAFAQAPAPQPHNVVLFVADGLRFRMVDDSTAPTMAAISREGVSLRNSHALFPTFTTANASGMATGHMLGDTGDFSNTIYAGFQVPGAGNTLTPFLENDAVLGDVDEHFAGNYLDEATILKLARDKGYSTASIGKIGPALIFDPTERSGTQTILVDDATGTPKGIPLSAEITQRLQAANLPLTAPSRGANGAAGNMTTPGTLTANVVQQDYFAAVTTKAVLPLFKERNKPFVLVFWSRDPDGSQHNQGDSLNALVPGINGPTSLAAIRNADDDLARIRSALRDLGLLDSTDIITTADHGFSTIGKESQTSATVKMKFADAPAGRLPLGFVALDLAHALNMPLIDPDDGYKTIGDGQHTKNGNGLIGGDRQQAEGGGRGQWRIGSDLPARRRQSSWPSASSIFCSLKITSAACSLIQSSANSPAPCRLTTSRSKAAPSPRTRRLRSISAPSTPCAASRYGARWRLPIPFCSKAKACTARSAAPTPGISWRCRDRTSNRASSTRRRPAMPISAAPSRN